MPCAERPELVIWDGGLVHKIVSAWKMASRSGRKECHSNFDVESHSFVPLQCCPGNKDLCRDDHCEKSFLARHNPQDTRIIAARSHEEDALVSRNTSLHPQIGDASDSCEHSCHHFNMLLHWCLILELLTRQERRQLKTKNDYGSVDQIQFPRTNADEV